MEIKGQLLNPEIKWVENTKELYLKFSFNGKLLANDAEKAINIWKGEFARFSDKKINLIWECTRMNDYEPKARIAWQKAIKQLKNQINKIYLITQSKVIKLGAKMISTFTSFEIEVFESESELKLI